MAPVDVDGIERRCSSSRYEAAQRQQRVALYGGDSLVVRSIGHVVSEAVLRTTGVVNHDCVYHMQLL